MRFQIGLTLAILGLAALPVWAEHASVDLRIFRLDAATGKSDGETEAHADQEPPAGGVQPRPLFKAKANQPLVLQFMLDNTYPHGDVKDVTVTYFVARVEKPKQKTLPDLDKAVTKGSFTLNFKPKARVGARVAFKIKEPGFYLLRVHTTNTNSDHEHFSAIDLQIE